MTADKILQLFPDKHVVLSNAPPFIWPEPRWHTGQGRYNHLPPFDTLIGEADFINGVLVGTADKTVGWLSTLLKKEGKRRILLVVIVYPAGPTRQGTCPVCKSSKTDHPHRGPTRNLHEWRRLPGRHRVADFGRHVGGDVTCPTFPLGTPCTEAGEHRSRVARKRTVQGFVTLTISVKI